MNNTINWGIIGLGHIARKFAEGLKVLPDARLLAVASRTIENARRFGEAYQVPCCYDNYETMLQNQEVDVVYIASPHVGHHEHTLLCLRHGKAVLCEKPFAINLVQVREMVELAQQKQVFLMEALWSKFLPSLRKVRELVGQGVIGEVKSIQADFGFRSEFKPEGRLFNPALGGGSLLDIGIYPLFLATMLLGRPAEVKAVAQFSATGVDEQCSMSLRYQNGAVATLLSTIVAQTPTEAYIAGTLGGIRLHNRWLAPTTLTLHQPNQEPALISFDFQGNGYHYQAVEVMDCLRQGRTESLEMSHEDSLLLMEVMDWVRREAGIRYREDEPAR